MLIPHIKYIEALVIAKKSIDEILDALAAYNLHINEEAISIIISTIRKDNPEYFDGVDPEPAHPDWIEKFKVEEMFCYLTNFSWEKDLVSPKKAFDLIDDPLMYRLITSLALAKITDEDIELVVNGKFNMDYGVEDINLFLKYFFDVSEWTLRERQDYVEGVKDNQLTQYYKIALKGDKDYLLWKLGAAPEKDFGEMLKDMVHDSYYNFKEQSRVKPDIAQRWASLAVKLTDKIDNIQKEDSKSAGNFLENYEFKIKTTIEAEAPKIAHLNDLQPDEFEKNIANRGGESSED